MPATCLVAYAADSRAQADIGESMKQEIIRGSDEIFSCASGVTGDEEVADCLSNVLDSNIQKNTDTAPFLAGAYFTAFARLACTSPTSDVKEKWLATCLKRFSEIETIIGIPDKELAEITQNVAILPEIEKMRLAMSH